VKKSHLAFLVARIALDAIMIFVALIFAYFCRMQWFEILSLPTPTTLFPLESFLEFSAKSATFLVAVLAINGRYKFKTDEKFADEIWNVFWTLSSGMAFLLVWFFFAKFYFFSRFIFGVAWVASVVFVLAGRIVLRAIRISANRAGIGRARIVLLGSGKIASQTLFELQKNPEFDCVGILTEKKSTKKTILKQKILGTFNDLEKIVEKIRPDEIWLASESSTEKITPKLVRITHIHHANFRFIPDELGLDLAAVEVGSIGEMPLLTCLANRLDGWSFVVKSAIDRIFAAIALVILSPIFAIIAWKIRREDGGDIFYKSERIGKNGEPFFCWKFRSMVPNAEKRKSELLKKNERPCQILFKIENDPRVTKFGKFLRMWSLDELPQFWNVLRGEMSIIGPRPHLSGEVKKYQKSDLRVLSIRPGITGFAQIHGRSSLSIEEELKLELFYAKNWSLRLDAMIFLKTIKIVLRRENVC